MDFATLTVTLTLGTLNIRYRLPAADAETAARAMLDAGEQVGGRQECSNRVPLFESLGQMVFMPKGGGLGMPIVHRGVDAGEGGVFKAAPALYDPEGAGPDTLPPRYVVWRRYTDPETGGVLTVANTHAIPSIYQDDRRAIHAEHMRNLAAWARATPDPLVIVGDFNCQWGHANMNPLRTAGFKLANPPGVTHKKTRRAIDLILVRGVTVTSARIVDTPSDHKGVVATVNVPAPPPEPAPEEPGMKFVSRAEWGARYPKGNTAIGSTLGITLHWEGPHMGVFPHTACDDKVRGIERFHSVDRGWAGIAYNALVCPHGYVFEGRGVGIRSAANGDTQSNDDWYAVCYLGGERDGFTDEGKQGFRDAIAWLRAKGAAGPRVNGHRDHKSTACPGDEIYRWLKTTNFDTAAPTPAPTPPEDEVTPEDIKNIGQAAAAAVVEKLIPRPDAPDTNIRLGNAVAQAWHRSGRAVNLAFAAVEQSKRNAEALSALADSLDGGNLTPEQVADAIREAVGDRLQLEVTLRENPPEATS